MALSSVQIKNLLPWFCPAPYPQVGWIVPTRAHTGRSCPLLLIPTPFYSCVLLTPAWIASGRMVSGVQLHNYSSPDASLHAAFSQSSSMQTMRCWDLIEEDWEPLV